MTVQTTELVPMTPEQRQAQDVRNILEAYATEIPGSGLAVAYHTDPRNKVSIPVEMELAKAAKILAEAAQAATEKKDFSKTFKFRPWDGAAALHRVMQKHFGTTGRGIAIKTMFGSIPPKEIEIEVAYGQTIQVPWGHIEFATLEGTLQLGATYDDEYGALFNLVINAPKKYSLAISGFFNLLEQELKEHSIYKGAAIRGTDEPKFIDTQIDPNIVYNDEVYQALEVNVWGVLRNADLLRQLGLRVDPKVLLHGPFGTGKSEAGRMTAREAVSQGWTFISFNSGKSSQSDLEKTIQTARLLAPAVVFVEDVEIYANVGDDKAQSRLLEMFDGISSKNSEVMVLMTSNHIDQFPKGMLRAGRINAMIEIGPLNEKATEELIRRVSGAQLGEVNFPEVFAAMEGYQPAFVRQSFDDARKSALLRQVDTLRKAGEFTREKAFEFKLNTEDFVYAAQAMRAQHAHHDQAASGTRIITLDKVFRDMVKGVLTGELEITNENFGSIEVREIEAADAK